MELQRKSYDRIWTNNEVQALLSIYAEDEIQTELGTSTCKKMVYDKISCKLSELNIVHTPKQCREKLKKLKQDYRRIKDHNNRSGDDQRTGKWFEHLDAVLGHKTRDSDAVLMEAMAEEDEDVPRCYWSQAEIQALVTLWANPSVQEQLRHSLKNEKVFASLSARLASLGFSKTPNRCREKIKKLKVEYRKIKKHNCRGSTDKEYGRVWFAIMDDVLSYQPGAATQNSEPMELPRAEPSLSLPPEAQPFLSVKAGVKKPNAWANNELQALLRLWADKSVQKQLRSTARNNKIFIQLSSQLAALGFYKPPLRCREKIKKLKHEYKKIKLSGRPCSHREKRWFSIVDSVLNPHFAAGEAPVDSDSRPSCLEFDKSEKSPSWSSNEVPDVLGYQPGTLGLEPINSPMSDSFELPDFNDAGTECITWSPQEVDDLVMLWADNNVQKQLLSTYENKRIFTSLSSQLMMMGYNKTASQCQAEIKTLKHEYRRAKDTGDLSHQHGKWFIIMDDVLSHQPETLSSEEADSAETPLKSIQPTWSVKVENSEGPSISLDSSGCDLKTFPPALEPAFEDAPLEDKNHCTWLPDEVQVFLTLWAQPNIQEQLLSTVRNNKVFTYISNQLATVGFHKTANQCRIKVKKLKQCYKKLKCMQDKQNDSKWFAIMDSVLDPGGENAETETSELREVDLPTMLTHPGSPEHDHMNDNIRTSWTPDEVQILLTWWAQDSIRETLMTKVGNEKVYAQVSSELAALGFNKTTNQCRFKLKKLKQEYKKVKDQKDSKRRESTWFVIMDNILNCQEQELEMEKAAEVTDSAPPLLEKSQHGFPEPVEDKGGQLSLSTLSLLVPTLRLMCAFAWQVVQHCNVLHYGKVEELVRLVTELVPGLLTPREKAQLLLRLRARLVLELCRSEKTANLQVIQPHLEVIHSLTKDSSYDQEDSEEPENSKSDFVEIIHTLLNNPEEKETFFKEVFPVRYGQQYEATLHSIVWKFISRVDELLPIPDVKQTAVWLSGAPIAMEECGQLVLEPHQLKTLLHHQHRQNNMEQSKVTSGQINESRSECTRYRAEPVSDGNEEDEGQSDHCREEEEEEEEAAEEKQSDDEWTPQDWSQTSDVLELEDQQKETLAAVKQSAEPREVPSGQINESRSECTEQRYRAEPVSDGNEEDEGQSDRCREEEEEEEAVEEKQSDDEWTPQDSSQTTEVLELEDQQMETLAAVKQSDVNNVPPSRLHSCSLCPFTHSQVAGLLQHIRQQHLVKEPNHVTPAAPQTDTEVCSKHTCHQCGMVFTTLHFLAHHMRTHSLPFRCNQCNKIYSRKEYLIKHQLTHTGERPHKCPHCGRGFTHLAILKSHVRTHTGDRPYICHICGKTSAQHLARHILMHKGEKNYLCTECGKAFLSSGELRLHMRYHTGERPYTCKYCGKGYIAKTHLTIHMRVHTGERPYSCSQCPKSFTTTNLLKRHSFTHYDKKPFQCFKCGKGFVRAHAMKTHIRTRRCK
ncbi:uncharacterized protein LOC115355452 isoform X4 [Myripristis murdjan]|uniref:uncharacterized protein LOC115355452 isoform X4 n=1 Tax=Myripristis murdjan TaxID=586833 RepID=UPI001175D61F|nr:uncharacterized protein LOC115355452 isoform X4 [Myripristis murdjan]